MIMLTLFFICSSKDDQKYVRSLKRRQEKPDDTLLLLIMKDRKTNIMKKYLSKNISRTHWNTKKKALFATQIKLNMLIHASFNKNFPGKFKLSKKLLH